jgi:hypothetical protein
MSVTKEAQKYIVVSSIGSIGELGGISGPIINPTLQPISKIVQMVHNRKKVYEVNPNDFSDRVLLTLRNVRTNNFPEPTATVVESEKETTTVKKKKSSAATTTTEETSDFTKK